MAGPARKADPWLTERMRNDIVLLRHEQSIVTAVLRVMQEWLTATRTLILGGSLTASGEDVDAARGAFEVWRHGLETDIEPAIGDAFGAGFNTGLRTSDISVLPYQERHMDTVHSRLRMWPEGAFEDMRPELVQAITLGESMGDTADRVAGILDINAPTRRLRAKITEVDTALAVEDLTPTRRRDLRALRRRLWEEHDASLGEWQHLARRIARTECLPADSPVTAANITALYRRHYRGKWIEVRTGAGRKIAGTPNHPVLTLGGWKGLGDLTESDRLVCHSDNIEHAGATGNEHVQNAPPTIGEIFDAVAAVSIIEREAGAEPDFHGDGRNGDVHVLRPDWMLRVGEFTAITEGSHKGDLSPSDYRLIASFANSRRFSRDLPVAHGMSLLQGADWDSLPLQPADDRALIDAVPNRQRLLRYPGRVELGELATVDVDAILGQSLNRERTGGGLVPDGDAAGTENAVHGGFVAPDFAGNGGGTPPGLIKLDDVVSVSVGTFDGHVYNLTAVEGYYSGPGGIVTSNTHGAINGGKLAAAQAEEVTTGEELWSAWLATSDARCRRTHRVADGQMVRVGQKFRVGSAMLEFPGDPKGPAREVIQCRCSLLIRDRSEVDDQLRSIYARGVQPKSARLGPDPAEQADLAEQLVAAEDRGEIVEWPAPVQTLPAPQPVRAKREFAGRRLDDLADEMTRFAETADDAADWDYFDRLAAEVDRREVVNAANRARRQAAREARQEAQGVEYERLLAQGVDDEIAIEQAFGVSVADQRRQNAMSYLRGMGYQGRGLDDLIRAWYRDEVYRAWREAEDYTRGHMLARSAEGKVTNWADLWTMNEATARKYASEELRQWWDDHGRVSFAELKARLLGDSAGVNDITSARRDFVQ